MLEEPEYTFAVLPAGASSSQYPESEDDGVYVPESIAECIFGVAKAYRLQFSAHMPENVSLRWEYNQSEIQWVIEEFNFLNELLNDEVLNSYIIQLIYLCKKVLRSQNRLALIVEGP